MQRQVRIFFILAVVLCAVLPFSQASEFHKGINQVVSSLAQYQDNDGGFRYVKDHTSSLQATADAMFLASLFGQRDKVNDELESFVNRLKNVDNSFSDSKQTSGDLTALRNALLILANQGSALPDTDGVRTYIQSLYVEETNMYSNVNGGEGNLKSTAYALLVLDQLSSIGSANADDIRSVLTKREEIESGTHFFSRDVSENYFGIVVGKLVGFDFGNVDEWASFFVERQSANGAFLVNSESKAVSAMATEHAVSALRVLETIGNKESGSLSSLVNFESLFNYLTGLSRTLSNAASAYRAIANTEKFSEVLETSVRYESIRRRNVQNDRIILGSAVRPRLFARTSFGLAHGGLDASVSISGSGDEQELHLTWNAEKHSYECNDQYDATNLGKVSFNYELKWFVAELNRDVVLSFSEVMNVGYDISVTAKASSAGQDVEVGSEVGLGSDFEFVVDLKTGNDKVDNSKESIEFTVVDSSGEVQYTSKQALDGSDIVFIYVLEDFAVPSGLVTFNFGVKSADGYHTVVSKQYTVPVQMIASEITFNKDLKKYKLGDTIEVSMIPGSLPDLQTVETFAASKTNNKKFNMNILSASGEKVLEVVEGVPSVSGETLLYTFTLPIAPTFASVGEHIVTFSYVPLNGEIISLQNYDSESEEIYDDAFTYVVDADIHIKNERNSIKPGELSYGNSVAFSFATYDKVSGKQVQDTDNVGVKLVLKYKEGDRDIVTATKYADVKDGKYNIDWSVNPNARKGKGILELVADTASGEVAILKEKNNEAWSVKVSIDGVIDPEFNSYSAEINPLTTIFQTYFKLSCNDVVLDGADLVAKLYSPNGDVISTLPVSTGFTGGYQVSWAVAKTSAHSGEYKVELFRQVDLELETGDVFASTTIQHVEASNTSTAVPSDFIVLVILAGLFVHVSFKKLAIEGKRK